MLDQNLKLLLILSRDSTKLNHQLTLTKVWLEKHQVLNSFVPHQSSQTMASKSGVSLAEASETALAKFRSRKAKFVIYKITEEGNEIVVDSQGKRKSTIKDFFKALPDNQMRLALYNHEFTTADGRLTDKMFFIFWAPPGAKTESKMRYSSDKAVLRALCDGVVDLHATSQKDVENACGIKGKDGDDSDDESDFDPDA